MPKTCHVAVSKPKRNSFGKGSGGLCGAEAFESCCELLRVLRPGQNVPCSSFEAQ